MATRKELLEQLNQKMEELSDTISSESNSVAASNVGFSDAQDNGAQKISDAIEDLGDNLVVAALIGGELLLQRKVLGSLCEQIQEINRKSKMIESIQFLQSSQEGLSYQYAIERSSAAGATKDQRQALLNELIHEGIVTVDNGDSCERLRIEGENPKLKRHWEAIESIRREFEKLQ